jgi:TP901 family phage tail tape measure protein
MNIGTLVVTFGADLKGLITATSAATAALRDFEKRSTVSINTISQRFRTFGYLASATLTYPIIAAGKASITAARDFEFSMQKMVGLANAAQDSIKSWSDEVLQMGPEVAKRPQELAEALYFILSSGIRGAQALDVLKISAKAATAGLGETQDVANLLTSVLNAYAGTGITAAKAADILVAAVREGKGEADAFARTMGQIIPIAANLGVSFDEIAGGMAAITLTGSSAANAAVYLKGIFNALVTASSAGEKALNAMGTSYAQLRQILAEQGLIALLEKLRDLQARYGDEMLGDVIPNIRAMTAFLSLAGKNFQYNVDLMNRVTDSAGSLNDAFASVAGTIKVKYDQALAAANASLISLGKTVAQAVLPILEWLVKQLQNLTDWFNSLTESEQRHKLIVVALTAALGPLSLIVSTLGYSVSALVTAFRALGTVLVFLGKAGPLGIVAGLLGVVVTWMLKYTNNVRRSTEESVNFKKSLADVNTQLERFNQLSGTGTDESRFMYLQRYYNWAENAVKQQEKRLKDFYELAGVSADEYEKAMKIMSKGEPAVRGSAVWDEWKKAKKTLDVSPRWQKTIDAETQKLNTYKQAVIESKSAIDDFIAGGGPLPTTKPGLSNIIPKVEDVKEVISVFDQYAAELRYIDMMSSLLGDTYDANKAKLKASQDALEDYVRLMTEFGWTSVSDADFLDILTSRVEYYTMMTKKAKEETEEITEDFKLFGDVSKRAMYSITNAMADMAVEFGKALPNMEKGWMSLVDTVLSAASSIVTSLLAEAIAGIIAGETSKAGLWGLASAAIGIGALMTMWEGYKADIDTAAKMAQGGVVPAGYPNDTYPARLTSGEVVIPPGKLGDIQQATTKVLVEVDGKIRGRDLAIALRRANVLN